MSTSKSTGASRLGRDSESKRLGIKIVGGGTAKTGMIIIRQRGSKFWAGDNVRTGKDWTLYAVKEGIVKFTTKRKNHFDGEAKRVSIVSVIEA